MFVLKEVYRVSPPCTRQYPVHKSTQWVAHGCLKNKQYLIRQENVISSIFSQEKICLWEWEWENKHRRNSNRPDMGQIRRWYLICPYGALFKHFKVLNKSPSTLQYIQSCLQLSNVQSYGLQWKFQKMALSSSDDPTFV